jgi:hypothetical protein
VATLPQRRSSPASQTHFATDVAGNSGSTQTVTFSIIL